MSTTTGNTAIAGRVRRFGFKLPTRTPTGKRGRPSGRSRLVELRGQRRLSPPALAWQAGKTLHSPSAEPERHSAADQASLSKIPCAEAMPLEGAPRPEPLQPKHARTAPRRAALRPQGRKTPLPQPPARFAVPKERQNAAPNPQQALAVAQTAGKRCRVPSAEPLAEPLSGDIGRRCNRLAARRVTVFRQPHPCQGIRSD